ncbi:hypothetical protein Micbo1qcDRAFT_35106 [Microdochium bolleyi]|uniref:Uncharacterized protein n=1 Tax=Microdochium bolleyi TaxID=196109 RepID=A0A136IN56_9PEZI|nr:hypothetical protein Micbo1qcDRAFT_35106 [Microdochium bolleyi]
MAVRLGPLPAAALASGGGHQQTPASRCPEPRPSERTPARRVVAPPARPAAFSQRRAEIAQRNGVRIARISPERQGPAHSLASMRSWSSS